MGTAFYDDAHKRQKLNGTICLYRGEPFHIDARETIGENLVRLVPIDGKRYGRAHENDLVVDYRSPDFDYKAPKLGYTTYNGRAYYVARLPDRVNYQGLHSYAVTATHGDGFRSTDWFYSKEAKDCILGRHKSFEEAIEAINEEHHSCSFDRYFAVSKFGRLGTVIYSRGRAVAYRFDGDDKFKLTNGKDKKFLRDSLEKKGVVTC